MVNSCISSTMLKGTVIAGVFFLSAMISITADNHSGLLKDFCIEERRTCFSLYERRDGVTWQQARNACIRYNAHLAAIVDAGVQNEIHQQLTASTNTVNGGDRKAWIGGEESVDNTWRWLNGTTYSGSLSGNGSDYKTCGAITKRGNNMSHICSEYKYQYICAFVSESLDCDQDVTDPQSASRINTTTGQCHILFSSRTTWYEANNNCIAKGGTLASITLDNIRTEYRERIADAWIGLRKWRWSWMSIGSTPTFNYTQWTVGAPSSYDEHCAFIDLKKEARWGDERCHQTQPYFLCQNYSSQQEMSTIAATFSMAITETIEPSYNKPTTLPRTPSGTADTGGTATNGLSEEALTILIAVLVAVVVLVLVVVIAVVLIRRRKKSTTNKTQQQDQGQAMNSQQEGDAENHPDGHVYSTRLPNVVPTSAYANPNHINSRVDGDIDAAGYAEVANDQSSRESGINHYAEVTDHAPPQRNGPELRMADTPTLGNPTASTGQHGSHVNSSPSLSSVDHKIAPDTGDIYRLPDKGHKDNEPASHNDYELTIRDNSLYGK